MLTFSFSIGQLHLAEKGSQVWVRGYLQNVRSKSKIAFLLLRQSMASIQAILTEVRTPKHRGIGIENDILGAE